MSKERMLGKIVLAGALAFGGVGASPAATDNQASAATVRAYDCNATLDKWYPLNKGEIAVVKASGAVVPADETIDGIRWYDNNGDTSTLVALKSKDNTNKTWVINNDNGGSVLVLRCGATLSGTETNVSAQIRVLESRT
ncbi:MAG TPA: hypothetical protein VES68_00220, partial [Candidatus Sulfotelmatobacter sp.]|nr:hypothetical protein [Candidatus Sulfotelmatobacter sp.]